MKKLFSLCAALCAAATISAMAADDAIASLGNPTIDTSAAYEQGLIHLTFPEYADQTAATSRSNNYNIAYTITCDGVQGELIQGSYKASKGAYVESTFSQESYYVIDITSIELVATTGYDETTWEPITETIGELKEPIQITLGEEPVAEVPSLGAPTIDLSTVYDNGLIHLTFPEFEDQTAATSRQNNYVITYTITCDGVQGESIMGSYKASKGAYVESTFSQDSYYVVDITSIELVATTGYDETTWEPITETIGEIKEPIQIILGTPTALSALRSAFTSQPIYNLQGQKADRQQGLLIVGGNKVIIK